MTDDVLQNHLENRYAFLLLICGHRFDAGFYASVCQASYIKVYMFLFYQLS